VEYCTAISGQVSTGLWREFIGNTNAGAKWLTLHTRTHAPCCCLLQLSGAPLHHRIKWPISRSADSVSVTLATERERVAQAERGE
jgi:hypothetical protein